MSLMTWTNEQFGTNVSAHDQEHQEIFRLVNALGDAVGGAAIAPRLASSWMR